MRVNYLFYFIIYLRKRCSEMLPTQTTVWIFVQGTDVIWSPSRVWGPQGKKTSVYGNSKYQLREFFISQGLDRVSSSPLFSLTKIVLIIKQDWNLSYQSRGEGPINKKNKNFLRARNYCKAHKTKEVPHSLGSSFLEPVKTNWILQIICQFSYFYSFLFFVSLTHKKNSAPSRTVESKFSAPCLVE